jgi:cell division protein FtsX
MQCTYDYSHEAKRKSQSELIFNRDPKYIEKEERIREQLKQIEDIKKKRIEEEKKTKATATKERERSKKTATKIRKRKKEIRRTKIVRG